MKDADFEKQKGRIRKLADQWIKPIGLGYWRIDIDYSDEHRDGRKGADTACVAQCRADWEYQQATLTFYLPECASLDDADLEYCFVHELCHIFVNEMRMWGTVEIEKEKYDHCLKHEERVVSQIAKGFIWIRHNTKDQKARVQKKK